MHFRGRLLLLHVLLIVYVELPETALGETCSAPVKVYHNPCADMNADCLQKTGDGYKCRCKPGYTKDGQNCVASSELQFGDFCIFGLSPSQCVDANAECAEEEGGAKCRCKQGYIKNERGNECIGDDSQCTAVSGTCQQDNTPCSGDYQTGLCSGPASRKCCVPAAGDDSRCTAVSGTCQQGDTPCSGDYQTGLCSGPASRKCCVPAAGDDSQCTAVSGICQQDNTPCTGDYQTGLCSGPASRKCCLPAAESESSSSDSSSSSSTSDTDGSVTDDCEGEDNALLNAKELANLKNQLKIDEGNVEEIYKDSTGHLTFGIGHKITSDDPEHGKPVGTKVSAERIDEAFKADVCIAMKDVKAIFPDADTYPSEVKEILVNMAFNLGRTRLKKFKKFIAAVKKRDWETAADEMEDSEWYNQVKDRAKRLVKRMRAVEE